jgi:hypothetical protein
VVTQSKAWVCWNYGFESHREDWMSVCLNCRMLSGRGLCDELITRPEKSYRLWWVVMCDLETSWIRRPRPTGGPVAPKQTNKFVRVPVCNGFRDVTPVDFNPGTRGKCVVNFTPRPSQLWERKPKCPLNMRLCGSQGRPGSFGVKRHLLSLSGFESQTV